jgi:chromosome segregation ATPase
MANPPSKFNSRVQQQTVGLIKAIERIHEEESEGKPFLPSNLHVIENSGKVHIVRAENISRENDRLRKELYDLEQRVKILTERLGFDNLDRAEESLDENLIDVVREHKAAAARIETLTAELASIKSQLALEQAARIEDQQQLESLGVDLARKKQSSLEAQADSELNREALGRLKLELQSEWKKTSKLESMLSSLRKENEAISSECDALKAVSAKDRAQRSSLAPETPLRAPMMIDSGRTNR